MTLDSKESKDISLLVINAKVFSRILGIRGYKDDSPRFQVHKCLHLLHMVRSIFIQPGQDEAMRHDHEELPLAYIPFNNLGVSIRFGFWPKMGTGTGVPRFFVLGNWDSGFGVSIIGQFLLYPVR